MSEQVLQYLLPADISKIDFAQELRAHVKFVADVSVNNYPVGWSQNLYISKIDFLWFASAL